jgi:hypothetical protein
MIFIIIMTSSVDRDNAYCHYVILRRIRRLASQLRCIIIRQDRWLSMVLGHSLTTTLAFVFTVRSPLI